MGNKGRWEYLRAIYERYRQAGRKNKKVILSEFCVNTGYHRKYAIRLLNGPRPEKRRIRRERRRGVSYHSETLAVLTAVWGAAGYPWSVRLKALLPRWMPWIRKRFRLRADIEAQLLKISPRQMDRRLKAQKTQRRRCQYGRTKPGYLLKHHIAVKTDRWDVQAPVFAEIDLVSHSGESGEGEFGHTLNLTDIHSGWTESRALLGKSEVAVKEALDEIRAGLPFRLLGVDSDNGSEFINWHLKRWCDQQQIQLTRGRPYKKDDNAHIEQKNWTHVRKLLGWERYDSQAAVEAMSDLYREELRLWMNLYLPSVKLLKKVRVGSRVRRIYSPAQTPLDRVLASRQMDAQQVAELKKRRATLDPFELAQRIEGKLERIYVLANRRLSPKAAARGRTAVEKPRAGKVQNADFPTSLGNPAKNAAFPLSHSRDDGGVRVTFLMSRQQSSKLHS